MKVVIDASVSAKWFLQEDEESTEMARRILLLITEGDIQPIVPNLWFYEMLNIFWKAVQIKGLPVEIFEEAVSSIQGLGMDIREQYEFGREILSLAVQLRTSVYDASYIELSKRENAILLTEDKKLLKKAKEVGVEAFSLKEFFKQ